MLYIIVDGQCNQICTNTKDKFKNFEHEEDPTKTKRRDEIIGMMNPYKKYTAKEKIIFNS